MPDVWICRCCGSVWQLSIPDAPQACLRCAASTWTLAHQEGEEFVTGYPDALVQRLAARIGICLTQTMGEPPMEGEMST